MSRKLDVALAEALGEDVRWYVCVGYGTQGDRYYIAEPHKPGAKPYLHTCSGSRLGEVPHYSTDGNAMLELDKEMRGRGWMLEIYFADASDEYVVDYEKPNEDIFYSGLADTMPKAVALAAYRALTGKEWVE